MYKFTCTKGSKMPLSKGEWIVGIVFRHKNFFANRWCFHGVVGNKDYAHGFSYGLAEFVGHGEFERIG